MSAEDVLQFLTQRLELLQRKLTELLEQREEVDRQIRVYKELFRYYRGVYEAEKGVGLQAQPSPELVQFIEEGASPGFTTQRVTRKGMSVPKAIFEVLAESSKPMHHKEICDAVKQKFPDLVRNLKQFEKWAGSALVRGYQQGLYERTAPNTYRIKRVEDQ